jgi:chromosomal replication initiation ATPase DnaA
MSPQTTTFKAARIRMAIEIVRYSTRLRFGLSEDDLDGRERTEPLATRRQMAMVLCRELAGASYPDIAAAFSRRDHTTVMHACIVLPIKLDENAARLAEYNDLKRAILSALDKANE